MSLDRCYWSYQVLKVLFLAVFWFPTNLRQIFFGNLLCQSSNVHIIYFFIYSFFRHFLAWAIFLKVILSKTWFVFSKYRPSCFLTFRVSGYVFPLVLIFICKFSVSNLKLNRFWHSATDVNILEIYFFNLAIRLKDDLIYLLIFDFFKSIECFTLSNTPYLAEEGLTFFFELHPVPFLDC